MSKIQERKSHKTGIHFNAEEYEILKRKADAKNVSFGKFVKSCALEKELNVTVKNIDVADPKLIKELNYVGNNLNQITKRLNEMRLANYEVDSSILNAIKQILQDLNHKVDSFK